MLEVAALREAGVATMQSLATALTERGVPAPRGGAVWTHTTVARVRSGRHHSIRVRQDH